MTTTVATICRICGCSDAALVSRAVSGAPDASVYRCSACDFVYLSPMMTEAEEETFYREQFDQYMRGRWDAGWKSPEAHFRSFQSEADRRLPLVTPHLSHADEVLEIGSSTGYFLDRLHPSVRSVTGVEPSDAYRAFAIARGIETVESVDRLGPRKFDVILLYYVMEHLRDPVGYATSLKQRLTEGGHLLIEVPNVDDALLTVYKVPTFPGFYFQKAHYNNFSHRTLSDVLRRAGYRVQVFPEQRYDLSNHMVWMLEGKPGGHGRFAEILGVEADAAYRRALKTRWICDTVFAVATA